MTKPHPKDRTGLMIDEDPDTGEIVIRRGLVTEYDPRTKNKVLADNLIGSCRVVMYEDARTGVIAIWTGLNSEERRARLAFWFSQGIILDHRTQPRPLKVL